jgi:hypothetical protein
MATERNVVDFKIHNLTEEQFQELKAQGKIDPNAVYCTPDESLKRNQITNCITEIPQDIKLELTGGTLTLKAGSKAYRPNGSGVFDIITISSDKTLTNTTDGTYVVCVASGGGMIQRDISKCVSGATRSLTTTYMLWYDTTNNVINNYGSNSSTATQTVSLPIAIITVSDGAISSIDQVFNGFGYIGSTVFVLPEVKGLIPNGRNEDGTLKNTILNVTSVQARNFTGTQKEGLVLTLSGLPSYFQLSQIAYDPEKNLNYRTSDKSILSAGLFGSFSLSSGLITSFNPKPAFHAVDYSDFEELDNSAVHKTGDETIGGIKTFTGSYLQMKNNAGGAGVKLIDSGGKGSSELVHYYVSSEQRYYTRLVCRNTAANKYAYVELTMTDGGEVRFGNANLTYMNAPTPSASSNSTDVATTAWVRDLFETLYPVGSLYITSTNTTTCPLASIVKKSDGSNSTWALVSSGKALWTGTGSNGNSTIAAGLPNITGDTGIAYFNTGGQVSGAFQPKHTVATRTHPHDERSENIGLVFDASKSNSIYGNSTTVQPPAYVVNVWRRTA